MARVNGMPYDGALQMFVHEPAEISLPHLGFLRWLARRGAFGPRPLSAPTGRYVDLMPKVIRSSPRAKAA